MSPDGVEPGGPGPHDPGMEARVGRLEEDMRDVNATLGRFEPMLIRIDAQLQATLPHLVTKAEVAELRTELKADITRVDANLVEKPTRTFLVGILGLLLASFACGLAGLAVLK